jgi:hypothetical protein
MSSVLPAGAPTNGMLYMIRTYGYLHSLQIFNARRQFTTSQVLLASRHKQPKIRVPSKKALAAKARRKAAIASKLDEQTEKISLMDAIAVLRVSRLL